MSNDASTIIAALMDGGREVDSLRHPFAEAQKTANAFQDQCIGLKIKMELQGDQLAEATERIYELTNPETGEVPTLKSQLAQAQKFHAIADATTQEARANERTAMGYLADIRKIVGGDDFPDMVKRVAEVQKDAEMYRRAVYDLQKRGWGVARPKWLTKVIDKAIAKNGKEQS